MSHWERARMLIVFVGHSVCGEKDRWNSRFVQRVNIFILCYPQFTVDSLVSMNLISEKRNLALAQHSPMHLKVTRSIKSGHIPRLWVHSQVGGNRSNLKCRSLDKIIYNIIRNIYKIFIKKHCEMAHSGKLFMCAMNWICYGLNIKGKDLTVDSGVECAGKVREGEGTPHGWKERSQTE